METLAHRLSRLGLSGHIKVMQIDRPLQLCVCPEATVLARMAVRYCPRHGEDPDPKLWNYSVEPHPHGG